MTPKKCMSIAKSLTDTQHMELEPLCSVLSINLKLNSLLFSKRRNWYMAIFF